MQVLYRLNSQEISMDLLKTIQTLFAGQEVEITVRPVEEIGDQDWNRSLSQNPAFSFLKDDIEDIYSMNDGIAMDEK